MDVPSEGVAAPVDWGAVRFGSLPDEVGFRNLLTVVERRLSRSMPLHGSLTAVLHFRLCTFMPHNWH